MNHEIMALKKNKTSEVVNKPFGGNIVGSKWVFKTKKNAEGMIHGKDFKLERLGKDSLNLLALTLKTPLPQLLHTNHSGY